WAMKESQQYFEDLLKRYLSDDISEKEVGELFDFIASQPEQADVLLSLDNRKAFEEKILKNPSLPMETSTRMLNRLFQEIGIVDKTAGSLHTMSTGSRVQFIGRSRRVAIVAASIFLLAGLGCYFLFLNTSKKTTPLTNTINTDVEAPKNNQATITLSNGQKVYLNNFGSGTMAVQDNIKLVKLANGEIAYQATSGEISNEIKYNILENPRGSRTIDMILADGSRVWLNAGSSITYPVAFIGHERRVTITGEAYFEVAHDATKPFYVGKGDVKVQVMGTHFNVNAYDNESDIQVTLLEGSVKVFLGSKSGVLKPGEQAQLSNEFKVVSGVNTEEVMAWKNGTFRFNRTSLEAVMRQVERWYAVEVIYEQGMPAIQLGGEIKRDLTLSQLLDGLGEMGVKFEIQGKKLYVKQ
ncbi:MAG: FecR domain-containing protein, partial [Flavitalea sp.]